MYWEKVVKEFINRKHNRKSRHQQTNHYYRHKVSKSYKLGEKYANVYLTRREAECMFRLTQGNSVNKIAEELKLSPRTIEYYIKNIKAKLDCHSKYELIEMIRKSDFLQHVDFD